MIDPAVFVLTCPSSDGIVSAMRGLLPQLSLEQRRQFAQVMSRYLTWYGVDGLYERVIDKTVQRILDEYTATNPPEPIASGEREGIRYRVYDVRKPPDGAATDKK